ncbi:YceI family protein [Maribellus sp. YY47]|uniref:YceI family protein n=1 Tax=Maribellus sp. YY47 TaxID=2929486 RepID=UPI002001BDFD|nr:YceI family protein [Maribellus sp. YY47]MCK3686288.1 YceI family protein [Maribellus sp. YY47]
MKKITGLLAIALFSVSVAVAGQKDAAQAALKVDTKASKVYWNAKKVTGEHSGLLSVADGTVYVQDAKVTGANINLDMNSIDCTDLEGEWKDKLVGHLKSDDFFSVEKHPKATFTIKSVAKDGAKHKVVGDLTIKGIKHEISFPADVKVEGDKITANGTATIDRTKYDIRYGSGKFFEGLGDKMIYDTFDIRFELVASSSEEVSMQ